MSLKDFGFKLGFYTLAFILVEDFLWFVLNPSYTLKNYKKEKIPWHKEWIMGIPKNYYFGFIAVLLILIFSKSNELLLSTILIGVFIIGTIILAPLYHKFYLNIHSQELLDRLDKIE